MTRQHPLVGKTITGVYLDGVNGDWIKFEIEEGEPIFGYADGDCCSVSWIEDLDAPENLRGEVLSVENIDMPDLGETVEYESYIAYYGLRITTTKGVCVIDYRNESNGYYGGQLIFGRYNPKDRIDWEEV